MNRQQLARMLDMEHDGRLTPEEQAQIRRHLAEHPEDVAWWQRIAVLDRQLADALGARLDAARLSQQVTIRIRARVLMRPRRSRILFAVLGAVAVLIFLAGLWSSHRPLTANPGSVISPPLTPTATPSLTPSLEASPAEWPQQICLPTPVVERTPAAGGSTTTAGLDVLLEESAASPTALADVLSPSPEPPAIPCLENVQTATAMPGMVLTMTAYAPTDQVLMTSAPQTQTAWARIAPTFFSAPPTATTFSAPPTATTVTSPSPTANGTPAMPTPAVSPATTSTPNG